MSRPSMAQLLEYARELRTEPMWSIDQANIVEQMQCNRLIDLTPEKRRENRIAPRAPIATAPCMVCLMVDESHPSGLCRHCLEADRRDRAE